MPGSLEVDWMEASGQSSRRVGDVGVEFPAAAPVHDHPNSHQDDNEDKDGDHQASIQGHVTSSL